MIFANTRIKKVDKLLKQIVLLKNKKVTNKNASEIELRDRKLHKEIADHLFASAKEKDYAVMGKIIKSSSVKASLVHNEKGNNIVQYSLLEGDNELFMTLFLKYYKYIGCYFGEIPSFFHLLMNRRNIELIKIFLTTEGILEKIAREGLCTCFYMAVQENLFDLLNLILDNKCLESKLEANDVQSLLIYCISHNQDEKVRYLISCSSLINKLSNMNIQNVLAVILFSKNIKALDIVVDNSIIFNFIMSSIEVLETIAMFAYNHSNVKVLSMIIKNKKDLKFSIGGEKNSESKLIEDSL